MRFENFYLLKVQAGVEKLQLCLFLSALLISVNIFLAFWGVLFNVVLACKYSILRKNFVGQIFVQEVVLAGSKKYLFH